jgi:hypothetical protein
LTSMGSWESESCSYFLAARSETAQGERKRAILVCESRSSRSKVLRRSPGCGTRSAKPKSLNDRSEVVCCVVWSICTVALFLKILIGRCSDGADFWQLPTRPRKSSVSLARPTLAGAKPKHGPVGEGSCCVASGPARCTVLHILSRPLGVSDLLTKALSTTV